MNDKNELLESIVKEIYDRFTMKGNGNDLDDILDRAKAMQQKKELELINFVTHIHYLARENNKYRVMTSEDIYEAFYSQCF